ncbi:MAG: GC-type dockerin domain-anchored protein [Phycisphaerales bacterium]
MKRAMHTCAAAVFALTAGAATAGDAGFAYIIEGSGFFGAPGIELARVGVVELANPSNTVTGHLAGTHLRFGGADFRPGTGELVGFENTTNALRIIDLVDGGNTLIDSIGFMDSGVAGMAFSNDGSITYVTTTVGAFVRVVQADADDGSVISVHNILTNSVSSLAVVPEDHPTLNPGDLYGLALVGTGSLRLVNIDLDTNSVTSSQTLTGIGFTPQFETGLDFTADGTLYAAIQGFDEVNPDVFVEISSHLYTIDPLTGAASDLGVIQADGTWDAVTLVIDDPDNPCLADIVHDSQLNFFDISAFLSLYADMDPQVDFNNDGLIDFFDLSIFLGVFTEGCEGVVGP